MNGTTAYWAAIAFLSFGALFFIGTVCSLVWLWFRECARVRADRKRWAMDPVRRLGGYRR